MRILIVSNCPLELDQGSGYVICGFAKRMESLGHFVEVHGPEGFIWFNKMRRLKRLRLLLGYTWTAIYRILSGSFDVIELWGGPGWLACWLLAQVPQRKFVIVSRSNGLEPHYRYVTKRGEAFGSEKEMIVARKTIEEVGYRHCDALTLVSWFDERYAQTRCYKSEDRVLVIENPLENEWIGQRVDFARDPIVGFVGSWIERKGSDILPEIMMRLLGEVPDCKFLVIGIGEQAAIQLRQDFPDEKQVEIIPFCPRRELLAHYQRLAVLLSPSVYESFGLIFAEAMSSGAALLATPVGFAAGLIDGKEYLRINDRSPAGVAAQLTCMLNNPHQCQTIARGGYNRVQSLRWDLAIDNISVFYKDLTHNVRMTDNR